jgi:hypothetical protein
MRAMTFDCRGDPSRERLAGVLARRVRNEASDYVGVAHKGEMPGIDLDRRCVHSFCHEALQIGFNRHAATVVFAVADNVATFGG